MPKGIRRDALIQSLHDLHAKYARLADSVQTTLQLLLDEHRTVARPHMASILGEALALDQERRASTNGHGPAAIHRAGAAAAKRKKSGVRKIVQEQRQRSADFLDTFDRVTPKPATGRVHIGSLVRRGYLTKKGDGYIRTAKPYILNPYAK